MWGKAIRALVGAVRQTLPLIAIAAIVGTSALGAISRADAVEPVAADQPESRASYLVHLGQPATLAVGKSSIPELTTRGHDQIKEELAAQLASLAEAGLAGAASYDATLDAFRVDLADTARARLASSRM